DAGLEGVEILLSVGSAVHVRLDQTAEHRRQCARLSVRVFDRFGVRLGQVPSGHATGTRVVHSVISCDAFVNRTIVGRSPFSFSLPCSMPLVASSSLVATCFQREYGAVITKSHFWASPAAPTVMSRADPSNRSMTTPLASGKFLSGSASTTSPTVHFQPLAACL